MGEPNFPPRASRFHREHAARLSGERDWEGAIKREVISALLNIGLQNRIADIGPEKRITPFEYAAAALYASEAFSHFLRFATMTRELDPTREVGE